MGKNFMGYNNASELITAIGNKIKAKYTKPSGGIPKSDLATAVKSSLEKADSALQSYTETDPTVPSWAKASNKPSYTASEVGAIATTAKGAASGVAELDTNGKVPSSQLPYYAGSSSAGGAALSVSTKGADVQLGTPSSSSDDCGDIVFLYGNGSEKMRIWTNTTYTDKSGPNIRMYNASGKLLFTGKLLLSDGTGLPAATTSAPGLMTADDKTKLNGIASGAQVNSITGVKGNDESSYRTGNVNLTPANIGAAAASDVSVTGNIAATTFATFDGIVSEYGVVSCINKHGKHVTGFIVCLEFNSPVNPDSLAFTVNSRYRPSASTVPILFILNNPFNTIKTGCVSPGGYIKNSGYCYCPSVITEGFTILFDYFTA